MENIDSRKSGSGLYSLNWNNYNTHLTKGIRALLTDDKLADVTLSCEGNCVRSHKLLLSLCSPYFKKLFEMQPHQKDSGTIVILSNVRFKDLKNIVKFIYTGEVKMQQSDLKIFLQTCKMLKLNIMASSETPVTKPVIPRSSSTSTPVSQKPMTSYQGKSLLQRNQKIIQPDLPAYAVDASSLCQTQLEPDMVELDMDEEENEDSNPMPNLGLHNRSGSGAGAGVRNGSNSHLSNAAKDDDDDDEESGIRIDEIKTEENYLYEIEDVEEEYEEASPDVQDEEDNSQIYSDTVGLEDFQVASTSQVQYTPAMAEDFMQESYGEQYEDDEEYTEPLYQYQQSIAHSSSQPNSNKLKNTLHVCDCGAKFYRKDSFRRHKKSHGAHQYKCPYCKKGFYRRDLYNRHLEAQHGEKPARLNQ